MCEHVCVFMSECVCVLRLSFEGTVVVYGLQGNMLVLSLVNMVLLQQVRL